MVFRVRLRITGPRSLMDRPFRVNVSARTTWSILLNGHLQLDLPADTFVCSSQYRISNQEMNRGWRASLNEPISDFVGKFRRCQRVYKVRLYQDGERRGRS